MYEVLAASVIYKAFEIFIEIIKNNGSKSPKGNNLFFNMHGITTIK